MGTRRLQEALKQLSEAIRAVEAVIDEMRAEHDALALHIFIARRNYRQSKDTKSGKRRDTTAFDRRIEPDDVQHTRTRQEDSVERGRNVWLRCRVNQR